ncbi:MAG: AEC family transporter [Tyzzerella sp.]|nr:AEC family transporter [Agathobacter sp.]MBQ2922345.1 AEC family transporter [Tyzzerella sp.]
MIFKNMIDMQLMMFLLVGIGFFIRKKGIVNTEGRMNMIDLCLHITLPFNVLHSFLRKWDWNLFIACGVILLLSVGFNAISVFFSAILYKKQEANRQKSLKYGTIISNSGFLGNPMVEGIYGSEGLLYAALFMLPVRIVMWTIGIAVFLKGRKEKLWKNVLTHPCIVAIYAGVIIMVCGIQFPTFVEKTIVGISGCNTPLSMMLVGMMLAEVKPKGLIDKTMVFYTAIRLLIIPAVVFAITAFLPIDGTLRGITVIMAGMPAPITTALLSAKYGGDEKYATGMIFLSTILSLITLPLWCLVL